MMPSTIKRAQLRFLTQDTDGKYGSFKEVTGKVDEILEKAGPPAKKDKDEEMEECGKMREIREEVIENLIGEQSEYQAYFKSMLKKWGVKGPAQLPPDKRKAFFNAVSKGWKSKKQS